MKKLSNILVKLIIGRTIIVQIDMCPYYFTKLQEANDIAITVIGITDIIAGILVYFSRSWALTSIKYILALSFFYLCLGVWSLATNALRKNYYDWRGIIDLVSAFCLASIFFGNVYGIFWILGIIIALKGILSIFMMTARE